MSLSSLIRLNSNVLSETWTGGQIRKEYLDKGIWILYLGAGMLVWRDDERESDVKSPLVLKPVLVGSSGEQRALNLNRYGA